MSSWQRDFVHVKYLSALSFVPPGDVVRAFDQISGDQEYPQDENLDGLYDYFERTYIARVVRGGRRQTPIFPINMWNQQDRLEEGHAWTNNLVERRIVDSYEETEILDYLRAVFYKFIERFAISVSYNIH